MKKAIVAVGIVVGCFGLLAVAAGFLISQLFRVTEPPQPAFGFTGNWRTTNVFGFRERPLPPAAMVWQDYTNWHETTNFTGARLYLARLGGATKQSDFRRWISSDDTPMGAQRNTNVEFIYSDSTNGTYLITWMMRGKHDTSFLRFDATQKLYQLQPYGILGDDPPRLAIVAIEGIRPEHSTEP